MTALNSFIEKQYRTEVSALLRTERFWSVVRTSPDENACWPWQGLRDDRGYGLFTEGGRNYLAHRVAFELAYGPEALASAETLDHLCHSLHESCSGGRTCPHRCCVRPSHLEPVSRGENTRRGIRQITEAARRRAGKRTECKYGHPWTEENVLTKKDGSKRCRICHREEVRRNKKPKSKGGAS